MMSVQEQLDQAAEAFRGGMPTGVTIVELFGIIRGQQQQIEELKASVEAVAQYCVRQDGRNRDVNREIARLRGTHGV
jgi:hypothetical protein